MPARPGEQHHAAKLTERKVAEMREWYSEGGVSAEELAHEFGVCPSVARRVIAQQSWKHVPPVSTKVCGGCNGKGRVPV